jgi:hypothetical protein
MHRLARIRHRTIATSTAHLRRIMASHLAPRDSRGIPAPLEHVLADIQGRIVVLSLVYPRSSDELVPGDVAAHQNGSFLLGDQLPAAPTNYQRFARFKPLVCGDDVSEVGAHRLPSIIAHMHTAEEVEYLIHHGDAAAPTTRRQLLSCHENSAAVSRFLCYGQSLPADDELMSDLASDLSRILRQL